MKTKSNIVSLDKLDHEILESLQDNARRTYSEIGRRLGVAHSTVYDRIKNLEKHAILKKYTAIVDLDKVGIKQIIAIMTVFTDPKESDNVAKRLADFENTIEVYTSLSEELIIIAKVLAEDQDMLHSFIANSIAPLPGVLKIRTSIITKKYKG